MNIQFEKYIDGLVPAIIQDSQTSKVLMLGYMNKQAYDRTLEDNIVTFYSRSKERLWTKGETSGNYLKLISIMVDCDEDALLVKVKPIGVVCHTGSDTCFNESNESARFIDKLEQIIRSRVENNDASNSYVASLFRKGINKVAQKVGEEAVEVIIEAKDDNINLFKSEAADLLFHYLILLYAKGCNINDIENELISRHNK